MYKPAYGIYFYPPFTLFLRYDKKTGEFVINLTTEKLAFATDYCGVRSGRDVDKFKEMKLTKEKAEFVSAPMIKESPVCIECKVREIKELGSQSYVPGRRPRRSCG